MPSIGGSGSHILLPFGGGRLLSGGGAVRKKTVPLTEERKMMSVIVRGMKMPENCLRCPMQFGGMCYVQPEWVDDARVAPTVDEAAEQGRPKWCPLFEVKAWEEI